MVRSYSKNRERNEAGRRRLRAATIVVRARPGHPSQGLLCWGGRVFPCALGRGGISARKREGDGATPLARMRLISGYYRREKLLFRKSRLALRQIGPRDGWCDAPADRNYNRPVTLPYPASSEAMMRPDRLYDCCIVLDWNLSPRLRGGGSAIFFHIARPGYRPTEGCVAVSMRTMTLMLPYLSPNTVLVVSR